MKSGDGEDKTRHILVNDIMEEVSKYSNHEKWKKLLDYGILSKSQSHTLWKDRLPELDRLTSLMVHRWNTGLCDIVPEATIATAKATMVDNGIDSFTNGIDKLTVSSFLCNFIKFKGMKGSDFSQHQLVSSIASNAYVQIQGVGLGRGYVHD